LRLKDWQIVEWVEGVVTTKGRIGNRRKALKLRSNTMKSLLKMAATL